MSFLRFVNGNTNATEEPMDGVQLTYFHGLWRLYGGWNGNDGGNPDRNTQYTSPDLVTWTKQRNADWNPSHSFSLLNDETRDCLFKVGSDSVVTSNSTDRSQIWRSNDGLNWTIVSTQTFLEELVLFFAEIVNGDIYIGGGHILSGGQAVASSVNTTVWKSTDGGVTFSVLATGITQIGGNVKNQIKWYPDINRFILACTPGKYDVVAGNRTYTPACYNVGIDWDDITQEANFPSGLGKVYADICYHKGKMWMINGGIAGGDGGVNTAEMWYRNKWSWAKILAVPLTTTHATGIASDGNTLAIACGNLNRQAYYMEEYNP